MKLLATTAQLTTADPEAIFALWADINNWVTFDHGIEWAKLDETFTVGATYTLKPKGGPKVHARILTIEPNRRFVDVSRLFGAALTLDHRKQPGHTVVAISMELTGPLRWLWALILGSQQQADLEASAARLIAKAEGRT